MAVTAREIPCAYDHIMNIDVVDNTEAVMSYAPTAIIFRVSSGLAVGTAAGVLFVLLAGLY